MIKHISTAVACLLATTSAFGQAITAPVAVSPAVSIAAPDTNNAVLRTGTEVALSLAEPLTTKEKQLRVGQRFKLTTSAAVVVQGQNVIPVGTPAIGEVLTVRNKGMWGKSGHFTARVLYLTVNGRQVHMTGTFDEKGSAGGWAAGAVSAIVFLPAGFFMTGKSAELPVGAPVRGFIDEDVPLAFASAASVPIAVPMAVPLSPAAADAVGASPGK